MQLNASWWYIKLKLNTCECLSSLAACLKKRFGLILWSGIRSKEALPENFHNQQAKSVGPCEIVSVHSELIYHSSRKWISRRQVCTHAIQQQKCVSRELRCGGSFCWFKRWKWPAKVNADGRSRKLIFSLTLYRVAAPSIWPRPKRCERESANIKKSPRRLWFMRN